MIVKIFHEYLSQSRPSNLKEDLQKLEDKINTFAGQKGVVIHDMKYETAYDYCICSSHSYK